MTNVIEVETLADVSTDTIAAERTRKLASIQRILALDPIEGADMIELATVLGWKVVVKKNEYKVGDLVIYLEIDAWVPHELAPFLSKGSEPREYEGVKGERLKTIRLRGQISQGLILPIPSIMEDSLELLEGDDVTDHLGIKKWEAPIPTQLRGVAKGNFPSFIRKTDEDRLQSKPQYLSLCVNTVIRGHEKLDGSSCTIYFNNGEFGVCSRNLNLKETQDNSFWQIARKYNLREKMSNLGRNIAIQGELVGPGIQGNKYNLKELDYFVFSLFCIDSQEYLDDLDMKLMAESLGLKYCPHVEDVSVYESTTVDSLLKLAEGKSKLNPKQEREGVVWRPVLNIKDRKSGERVSFKTISNKFLLSGGE